MIIIVLNISNYFNILFKYKYNFFIKVYLNNYVKIFKLITYMVRNYMIYNKNLNKHIKNRSFVNFSKRKIRVQKGLGKARIRNYSSPICIKGGSVYSSICFNKNLQYNYLQYKIVFIYLLLNKRSNILILRYEDILKYIYIFILNNKKSNLLEIILKILYFKGIINNYVILNLNYYNLFNFKYNNLLLNLIMYNYIIFII